MAEDEMADQNEAPIDVSNTPEELALSVVQSATPPRKPGRPRLENPKRSRRVRKKSEEEIWAENLAALPEAQRTELVALSDECRMAGWMMKDVAWLHIGYGTAGIDRIYPDLAFVDVKEHIRNSGGLIETYPKKPADMPESHRRYGLLTQLYAQDFRPFVYQVADWCHKHPEENFDREIETECTLISGWRAQPVRPKSTQAAFAEANKSHQQKDREIERDQAQRFLKAIDDGTKEIIGGF